MLELRLALVGAFSKTQRSPGRYFVALWNNIAITVWLARPDGETAKASVSCAEELKRTYSKFSVLHIAEEGAGLPTSEGREELIAGARNNARCVVCVGVLLPEGSVFANMLRVFIRGVRTLLRGELNTVLEQDVVALARLVVEIHVRGTGVRIAANDLVAAIGEARRLAVAAAA
ncbi:MAG TPA: hypothetical protein VJV78_13410 [Polyangiales bacterium]|nr:hypothetical protein [Polyangiales bacterium]